MVYFGLGYNFKLLKLKYFPVPLAFLAVAWLDGSPTWMVSCHWLRMKVRTLPRIGLLNHCQSSPLFRFRLNESHGSTWSPRYVSYGGNNRTHMIRIPEGGRFECRLVDGSANLYLAKAGILAAGLEGMAKHLSPGKRLDENMFVLRCDRDCQKLPSSLLEALLCLEQDALLLATLGDRGAKIFLEFKYQEWDSYNSTVTPWEMQQYINC